MFYIASNISSLLNVKWFLGESSGEPVFPYNYNKQHLGIPFNDTQEWRLAIAEHGQAILGDNLLGLQAGNEPDLYERSVGKGFTSSTLLN